MIRVLVMTLRRAQSVLPRVSGVSPSTDVVVLLLFSQHNLIYILGPTSAALRLRRLLWRLPSPAPGCAPEG